MEFDTNLVGGRTQVTGLSYQNHILKIKGWFLFAISSGDLPGTGFPEAGCYIISTKNFADFIFNKIGSAGNQAGNGCCFAYDSAADILHVVYTDGGSSTQYRACTPNRDGTVTWISSAQLITAGGSQLSGNIALDSEGYPWVIYFEVIGGANELTVKKSSTKNGTWTTDDTVTKVLLTTASDPSYFGGAVVAQTAGKMYFLFTDWNNTPLQGWQYDPAIAWDAAAVTISSKNVSFDVYDCIADGDDILLVYTSVLSDVRYIKFTYGTGWGAETILEEGISPQVVISKTPSGSKVFVLGCSWTTPGTVHRWVYKNSAWSTLADVSITSTNPAYCSAPALVGGLFVMLFCDDATFKIYVFAYGFNAKTAVASCGL